MGKLYQQGTLALLPVTSGALSPLMKQQNAAGKSVLLCIECMGVLSDRGVQKVGREPGWYRSNSDYHTLVTPFLFQVKGVGK